MPQSSPLNNVLKIHMGDLSGVSADVAFLLDGTIAKAFYASIGRPDVYAKMEPDSWGRRRKGFPPDLAFSHGTKQMMVSYVIQAVAPEWLQHYYRSFWDSAAFVGSAQGAFELLTKAPSASTGLFVAPDTRGDEAFTRICASQLLRAVELSPLSKNMIYVKDQGTLDVYESLWGRRGRGMPTQPKSGRSLQVIIEPSREVPKPISHDRHTASLRVSRYLGSSDGQANESVLLLGSEGELNTVDDGLVKPHLHGREILFLIDYDVSAFSQYVFGLANGTTAMKIAVTVLPHKFLRKEKSLIEGVTESTIRGSDFSIRIDPDRFLDADPIAGESFESNSKRLDLWITNLISVFSRPSLRLPLLGLLHETYTSRLGVFGASASLTVLSIGGESVSLDALRGVLQLALPDNRNSSRCDALILLILSPEKFDRAFNHVIREAVLAHFARPVEIFTEHLTNQDKARELKLGILPVNFEVESVMSTPESFGDTNVVIVQPEEVAEPELTDELTIDNNGLNYAAAQPESEADKNTFLARLWATIVTRTSQVAGWLLMLIFFAFLFSGGELITPLVELFPASLQRPMMIAILVYVVWGFGYWVWLASKGGGPDSRGDGDF